MVLIALSSSRDSDSAAFLTPALKKKRKLYSTTPQSNAVSSTNAEQGEVTSEVSSWEAMEVVGLIFSSFFALFSS